MTDTRRHAHDCDHCSFHGHMQGFDVYTCSSSLVLRWGSDGPEYQSLPMEMIGEVMTRPGCQIWSDAVDVVAASVFERITTGEGNTSDVPLKLKSAFLRKVDLKLLELL